MPDESKRMGERVFCYAHGVYYDANIEECLYCDMRRISTLPALEQQVSDLQQALADLVAACTYTTKDRVGDNPVVWQMEDHLRVPTWRSIDKANDALIASKIQIGSCAESSLGL